ncbi:hypothetical protein BD410DRAFT_810559, partial [Rickenella mellea]
FRTVYDFTQRGKASADGDPKPKSTRSKRLNIDWSTCGVDMEALREALKEFEAEFVHRQFDSSLSISDGEELMSGVEAAALNGTGDIGVGPWGTWRIPQMLAYLGLPTHDPIHWPMFMHPSQTLRWHQIGAQIFLTNICFSPAFSLNRRGGFICDEVGLGKSATALGFITYFATLIPLLREKKIPDILRATEPYVIPENKPTILICPHSVVENWKSEAKKWLECEGKTPLIQVLVYSGPKRHEILSENGPFYNSKYARSQILILVDSNSIATDIGKLTRFRRPRAYHEQVPMEIQGGEDEKVLRNGVEVLESRSILRLRSSLLFIDEIHTLRNRNNLHEATYRMAEGADCTFGMTATLVWTGPTDIYQSGRICKIPGLGGDQGNAVRVEMEREIKAAQKAMAMEYVDFDDEMDGDNDGDNDIAVVDALNRKGKVAQTTGKIRLHAVESMRAMLLPSQGPPYMLRRDSNSKDIDGNSLTGLPMLVHVTIRVQLTEKEKETMKKMLSYNSKSLKKKGREKTGGFDTMNFYHAHRVASLSSRIFDENGKTRKIEDVPLYTNIEEWVKDCSSKLLAFMHTYNHHMSAPGQSHYIPPPDLLSDNDSIDFSRAADVNKATFPQPPRSFDELMSDPRQLRSSPGLTITTTSGEYKISMPADPQLPLKAILYYFWPGYKQIIMSVLALFGIAAVWVDGETKLADRVRIYEDFNKDQLHLSDDGRPTGLLCFSPVGSVGLNFPRANMIFLLVNLSRQLDRTWGHGELIQVIGRIWRYPQRWPCFAYEVIVPNTIDEVMSEGCRVKDEMLSKAYDRVAPEQIGGALHDAEERQKDLTDDEDDFDEEESRDETATEKAKRLLKTSEKAKGKAKDRQKKPQKQKEKKVRKSKEGAEDSVPQTTADGEVPSSAQ